MKNDGQISFLDIPENVKPKVGGVKTSKKTEMNQGFTKLGNVLDRYKLEDKGGYITQEFQDFGYRLAMELGDSKRTSLYMRLAKTVERGTLEKALSFVKDAGAKNPAALFMWKVKKLRIENEERKSTTKK